MPSTSWVNLPTQWRLQDVQAALNVIITSLSVLGIFACARFCWQSAIPGMARHRSIPISDLITVNTFGEAIDIIWLLKTRIFQRRHLKILVQSCLAIILSVVGLVSGPIARYSTSTSHRVLPQNISGTIAMRHYVAILNAPVLWNETFTSLDQADFPHDQLLDYLPDPTIPWTYDRREWNSTWSLDCKSTERTAITLEDTGNCDYILDELPGLQKVISPSKYDVSNFSTWWGGEQNNGINQDVLLAMGAAKVTDYDEVLNINLEMAIDLAAVYLHNLSIQEDPDSYCYFGKGPVESASYTKIECIVRRNTLDPSLNYIAYPDCSKAWQVAQALVQYYYARFVGESIATGNITTITPRDLMRFYQVWVSTKDTQDRYSVTRTLSVRVPVVQLSTAFLAISILVFVLIILGLISYISAYIRSRRTFEETPQSKLEWMLRGVRPTERNSSLHSSPDIEFSFSPIKRPTTSQIRAVTSFIQEKGDIRRSEFENARYSDSFNAFDMSPTPVPYTPAPTQWQLPPLPFPQIPRKPISSVYTSASEIETWSTGDEGERLVSRAP
ncbi:uncharacterized protein A1O5_08680 [Cladophialophora psammophila CBS 110553]|uniref:Uncharacterized protein n=1 Tax=Cladophialophora psammophila CBS 110553 TaxID=1182543 RepID=W9WSR7_9EURO|nr:uncharacterized protein A1O5_08680 [Cladophialophora psammophila CBS 110553]EXJ68065.1 hypothetical protein A1O5_08680 [Cladophialophora psammophila CBS 110553]